jgi:CYTH domain-containing protein
MRGTEIERKFLVSSDAWKEHAKGMVCRQGYLAATGDLIVRVRELGDHGYLTIKGRKIGLVCPEYEYELPVAEVREMMERVCLLPLIEKKRYGVDFAGIRWVIDVFAGANEGLVVAEVELADENQVIVLPEWVGREVSFDPKYWNVNLMKFPYKLWPPEMRQG